jgi:thioredoxin-like negative regulator of GroEL
MKRWRIPLMRSFVRRALLGCLLWTVGGLASTRGARAGEEDDLQRQIDTQRTGVTDLDRLDEVKSSTEEITMLKSWLDEAWNLRSKHEYDQVREVLDRCLAQAELVRQRIAAAKLRTQVQKREAAVRELRAKIDRTRKSLQETMVKKKSLEGAVQ